MQGKTRALGSSQKAAPVLAMARVTYDLGKDLQLFGASVPITVKRDGWILQALKLDGILDICVLGALSGRGWVTNVWELRLFSENKHRESALLNAVCH